MVLEVASRGRIRYRGVPNSSDVLSCSSVHFVNTIMGGLVAKTHNINSHGRPAFKFKEITAIYDSEGACSIIEIPFLRDGKTAEYNCKVEEVEGDDNVNNRSNGNARDSDHDQNCDEFGFDEMTLMELKASWKKKRKVANSVGSMQQGKNSPSKGSPSHIQTKEEEPDLEEPLSFVKMRLSKNAKVKRKHIAKRVCSFPPESSGTGDLQSKKKSRLAPISMVMQSEPAIREHSTEDTPSLCQLNRIKSENVGIEIYDQNEACVFDSTAKFCIRNQSPCNEPSSVSLDSLCQLNQIKSENLGIFMYDQNESCVFDSTAKFCIGNQSPCNESSSKLLDNRCQLNQIKSENLDIEIYAQDEAYFFDSTAKFCITNQSPCNESSSESLDKVGGQRMETGESIESISFISKVDEFKVSSAEFCGMADGGELKTGDLTSVENSLRGTNNKSLAQIVECDDSGLELETGEDIDMVEASMESENHELSLSIIPELKMEIALDQPLSAGSPEAISVPSSLNSALCPNHEIKPALQEVLFEVHSSSITKVPDIASGDNLLCTETDDGWFCNSGNNDLGNAVNGILVEEEMPMEDIDQDSAPNTSNYSTVDISSSDAPSQNYLPGFAVADSSQPLDEGSSMTKVLLVSATTEELVPPIEDVSRDCSMDACAFDTSEVSATTEEPLSPIEDVSSDCSMDACAFDTCEVSATTEEPVPPVEDVSRDCSMDACAFDTSEVLTEEQEVENHHPPENLLSTRKVISPKSQEKLRQAVEADELCDRVQLSKQRKRLCFENWTKNMTSLARDAAEETEYRPVSHGPLKKLKYAMNESPPKGILKSSHISCMISCTCKDCSLIHERAEKAIAFSQRQMHDIECLTMKLLNGLKSMKYMVEDALVSRECPSTTSKYTADEMRIAADDTIKLEETSRKWLSMMTRDCNRFCKIMKLKDKATPTKQHPNGPHKERRKVVFADDIGGTLCHVKVLEDHSSPQAV